MFKLTQTAPFATKIKKVLGRYFCSSYFLACRPRNARFAANVSRLCLSVSKKLCLPRQQLFWIYHAQPESRGKQFVSAALFVTSKKRIGLYCTVNSVSGVAITYIVQIKNIAFSGILV